MPRRVCPTGLAGAAGTPCTYGGASSSSTRPLRRRTSVHENEREMGRPALVDALLSGPNERHPPSRWEAAQRSQPRPARGKSRGLTAVHHNFYLRFSEWIDAERAATTLRGRGYDATLRLGDDGNWLILASKAIRSWRLILIERRMKRLANRLNGDYDGYERDG
jgi:hypothetical protein